MPEVILCGRSNVGKSSLINSLFNRKNLAKISSTPGKTRSINYYSVDDKFYLVDLPGYGYAKTGKSERLRWAKLIGEFIEKSDHVNLAFHIIDSRHKPSDLDIKLNTLLNANEIPYLIILSKADKLTQAEFKSAKERVVQVFPEINPQENIQFYSTVKKKGRKEILRILFENFG